MNGWLVSAPDHFKFPLRTCPTRVRACLPEAMAEGLQQPMMTHQAVLAPQPPMNPPSMATMSHQAPANSYPPTEREPMNPPSMAIREGGLTMNHQTPANSYPLTERERPFACPDCEKSYPTAAGLCARTYPPTCCEGLPPTCSAPP